MIFLPRGFTNRTNHKSEPKATEEKKVTCSVHARNLVYQEKISFYNYYCTLVYFDILDDLLDELLHQQLIADMRASYLQPRLANITINRNYMEPANLDNNSTRTP